MKKIITAICLAVLFLTLFATFCFLTRDSGKINIPKEKLDPSSEMKTTENSLSELLTNIGIENEYVSYKYQEFHDGYKYLFYVYSDKSEKEHYVISMLSEDNDVLILIGEDGENTIDINKSYSTKYSSWYAVDIKLPK